MSVSIMFFKRYMGMTFMDYVYAIRLEHAYYDVINTDFPIGSIADHHGFEKKLQAFCPQIQRTIRLLSRREKEAA